MTERRQRIPADEVKDSKRWNLPFWTEPKNVVHSEEPENEEVVIEEEEIEVEPLTAEQLECIRQEAYNEGLEQGLIEGRQKGEKLGYDEAYEEGKKSGETQGQKLGFDAGFEQGEKQALTNTTKEQEAISKRYEAVLEQLTQELTEQKTILSNTVPDIILAIAKAVITEELTQGSEHIVSLVDQALQSLPLDCGEIKIEVNPQDLPFVEAAIEQGKFEGQVISKEAIEAGGCRVHTRYSTVNFTLSERWKTIEKQYHHQVQLSLNHDEDTLIDEKSEQPEVMKKVTQVSENEDSPKEEIEHTQNSKIETQNADDSTPDDIASPSNLDNNTSDQALDVNSEDHEPKDT
ncbi:hypothetical protein NBRC116188_16030 [Oceaniserpentilla sp. 4NH20-0058]|uniref:flagellar assembly protein FliH n=1 Tax=Oceaniserpentilla sp. 4NH20-0058 TaxID=3127660 RepID=UPI00310C2677